MSEGKMSEKEIQREIVKYLKIRRDSGKIEFVNNSVAGRFVGEGSFYAPLQSKSGSPDLLIFMRDTKKDCLKTIALEVKTETGKQSPGQIGWQERFEKLGGKYHIVRNIDDVIKIIEKEVEV